MSCIVMQQTNYPRIYVPMKQQNLDNPRILAARNNINSTEKWLINLIIFWRLFWKPSLNIETSLLSMTGRKFRPIPNFYRAIPAIIWGPGFYGLIRTTIPFSRQGTLISTQIPTGSNMKIHLHRTLVLWITKR